MSHYLDNVRRRNHDKVEKAKEATNYARSLGSIDTEYERDRINIRVVFKVIDAWDVAADAWEDAGAIGIANQLRANLALLELGLGKKDALKKRGFSRYGISIVHGIFIKGTTIAYIKKMNRNKGGTYFDNGNVPFFGRENYYGPYVGPGGVYFVQANLQPTIGAFQQTRTVYRIKRVTPQWRIDTVESFENSTQNINDIRAKARQLAMGKLGTSRDYRIQRKSIRRKRR